MAKQRLKQFESSKVGPSKLGFDGEEDDWVLVKKQRVIILLPSLPTPESFTLERPETSQSQAEMTEFVPDSPETTPVHTVVPSLPIHEGLILQKPETSQSQAELRDVNVDMCTMVPSLPLPERFILRKSATFQSQAELRDVIVDIPETTSAQTMIPSLPVSEHCTLQKPATFQSQAELRADTHQTTLVHTAVPSLPVTEHCTLQKPAIPESQADLRDFIADTHKTTHVHSMEPETCPDFTSVDKPEITKVPNHTTRKDPSPAPRRSLQGCRINPNKRLEIHRTRHNPVKFRRVMCSSIAMDNEKLRIVNLEKKVEKAGGFNQWVGSIGLGREFERMLRGQRMSKFQLVNLTMEKLKQMGALAVGPRRKLIHAIHCVYHPHCLRSSFN